MKFSYAKNGRNHTTVWQLEELILRAVQFVIAEC